MKTIKFIFAFIVLTLLAQACNQEATSSVPTVSSLAAKLSALEMSLNKGIPEARGTSFTLSTVHSKNNAYDGYGLKTYNTLIDIGRFMDIQPRGSDFDSVVRPYIKNKISDIDPYDMNFNQDERLLYDSYIQNINLENVIDVSKQYEHFAEENFTDQSKVSNFLKIVSNTKYVSFHILEKRTFSIREICANDCMREMFTNFNPINWAEFTIGFLGGSLYWSYASCWYDCW